MELGSFGSEPREWHTFISGFKVLIHDACSSDAERLYHLRNALTKEVKDHIGENLRTPAHYKNAIQELHNKYGNPQLVAQSCTVQLLSLTPFRDDDFSALKHFSATVRGVVATFRQGYEAELACHSRLLQLVSKLPQNLRKGWGETSWKLNPRLPTLADFDQFLDRVYMEEQRSQPIFITSRKGRTETKSVMATTHPTPPTKATIITDCPVCKATHYLQECSSFKNQPVEKRAEIIKKNKRCFRCLGAGHRSRACKRSKECGKDGCKYRHHILLHGAPLPTVSGEVKKEVSTLCCSTIEDDTYTALPIVPVTIRSNGRAVNTYALLDCGSQVTLVHDSISQEVKLKGPRKKAIIGTFHGQDPFTVSRRVAFDVASLDDRSTFKVSKAESVGTLNISRPAINWHKVKSEWPHLREVPKGDLTPADVKVLIGMDITDAHTIIESRQASPEHENAPRGIKTPFGWCIIGNVSSEATDPDYQTNALSTVAQQQPSLDEAFWRFCDGESFATLPNVKPPIPQED